MKYTLPFFIITLLLLSGCGSVSYNVVKTSVLENPAQPETTEQTQVNIPFLEARVATMEEKMLYMQRELQHVPIVTKDESTAAKTIFIKFFDLISQQKFDEAVPLLSSDFELQENLRAYDYNHTGNPAEMLQTYCDGVPTCLKTRVLKTERTGNYEYTLTVQFINPDGSTYIFGPCCGASEEDMPSTDTFTYVVKKDFEDKMVVMTLPLYRP